MAIARAKLINLATNKSTKVELPISDDEWYNALSEIGLEEDADSDEYEFDDFVFYDIDFRVPIKITTVTAGIDWTEVNDIIEKIDNIDEYDKEKLEDVVETRELDDLEAISEAIDNLDNYIYYPGVTNDYALGIAIVDELGGVDQLDKRILERYFDFEAYGNNCAMDGVYASMGFLMDD